MKVIILPRRVLAWVALVLACGALVLYAWSGPPVATTGVSVLHGDQVGPAQPHESGTPPPSAEAPVGDQARNGLAVQVAMERERSRAERLEELKAIAEQPGTSAMTRDEVQRRVLDELDRGAKEEELEELLEAKGYENVVVVLNNRGLTVSLEGRLPSAAAAARLGELASRMTGLSPERIVIMDGR